MAHPVPGPEACQPSLSAAFARLVRIAATRAALAAAAAPARCRLGAAFLRVAASLSACCLLRHRPSPRLVGDEPTA